MQTNIDKEWPSPSDIPLPSCFASILPHLSHSFPESLSSSSLSETQESISHRCENTNLSNVMVAPEEIERAIDEYLWHNTHDNNPSPEQAKEEKMYKQCYNKKDMSNEQSYDNKQIQSANKRRMSTSEFATQNTRYNNGNSVKGKRFTSPNVIDTNNANSNIYYYNNKITTGSKNYDVEISNNNSNRHEGHSSERKEPKEYKPVKWNSSCKIDANNTNTNKKYKAKVEEQVQATVSRVNQSLSTRATSSATPSWSSVERQSGELLSTAQHYVQEIEQMYHALKRTFDEVESKCHQLVVKDTMSIKQNDEESTANDKEVNSVVEVEVEAADKTIEENKKPLPAKEEKIIANNVKVISNSSSNSNKSSALNVKRKQTAMTRAKHEAAMQLQQQLTRLQKQWNRLQMLNTQRESNNRSCNGDCKEKKKEKMEPILNPDSVHALIQIRRNALQV